MFLKVVTFHSIYAGRKKKCKYDQKQCCYKKNRTQSAMYGVMCAMRLILYEKSGCFCFAKIVHMSYIMGTERSIAPIKILPLGHASA